MPAAQEALGFGAVSSGAISGQPAVPDTDTTPTNVDALVREVLLAGYAPANVDAVTREVLVGSGPWQVNIDAVCREVLLADQSGFCGIIPLPADTSPSAPGAPPASCGIIPTPSNPTIGTPGAAPASCGTIPLP